MQTQRLIAGITTAAALFLGAQVSFALPGDDCGYENGVQRLCGVGYSWVFGSESYKIPGNSFFGGKEAPDAEWEYYTRGWDGSSCQQNRQGVFVSAPNITIRQSESEAYHNLSFAIPITIVLDGVWLPKSSARLLYYTLQANGKNLIPPRSIATRDLDWSNPTFIATGSTPIKNEELRNVKLVIYDLIQKVNPSKEYECFDFTVLLGKGRIDLLP